MWDGGGLHRWPSSIDLRHLFRLTSKIMETKKIKRQFSSREECCLFSRPVAYFFGVRHHTVSFPRRASDQWGGARRTRNLSEGVYEFARTNIPEDYLITNFFILLKKMNLREVIQFIRTHAATKPADRMQAIYRLSARRSTCPVCLIPRIFKLYTSPKLQTYSKHPPKLVGSIKSSFST